MIQADNIYKVQLPGTAMGNYTLADKYLALDNEDNYTMVVLTEQFMPGEIVNGGDIICIYDHTDDPISGPWKLYSKYIVGTEELVNILLECPGTTVECRKMVMKGLHTRIAVEATSNKTVFVMNLSHNYDSRLTIEEFQAEYIKAMWYIDQVIR